MNAEFQGEGDEADVDQVKADDEEMIDGIGERFVAMKGVDEEDAAVFVEGAGDPDGDGDRNEEVSGVGVDDDIHIRSFLMLVVISVSTEKIVSTGGIKSSAIVHLAGFGNLPYTAAETLGTRSSTI